MAFPSAEMVETWCSGEPGCGSLSDVMAWAEFSDELRIAVLTNVGLGPDAHLRRLAMTTEAEVEDVVTGTRLGEAQRHCNLGEKSQIRMFFNGLKTASGTLPSQQGASSPTPPIIHLSAPEAELSASSSNAVALNGTVTTIGNKVADASASTKNAHYTKNTSVLPEATAPPRPRLLETS